MLRISVQQVTKTFQQKQSDATALAALLSLISLSAPRERRCVLNKVSFDAREGDIVGIVGKNGSGKSTLLRIIAGILKSDEGSVRVTGTVAALLSLDAGMKDRLTMHENIHLMCTFLGLQSRQIRAVYDDIVAFSGLEAYVHVPMYQFSTGMKQRAAFSVVLHADKDVILLDESFSAGDAAFRKQCTAHMRTLSQNGTTFILASHNLDITKECCNTVLWLDNGAVRDIGHADAVVDAYAQSS